ncbi:MAG: adenine phosphoribosyltransferase [Candidatus Omnitrophica bacterium]|nr:adenine phosphoribosyltransferase [Candidatus Omnitrophota bacterium]
MKELQALVRDIPNFPKEGIIFKDITPLLRDPNSFGKVVDEIAGKFSRKKVDLVACVEARGFILGGAIAYRLGAGLVPVRKKGKLPYRTKRITYALEYGEDTLEIHEDAIHEGEKVLIVDDLLATGGTAAAVVELVRSLGGRVVGVVFLVELSFLKGRERLKGYPVSSLLSF